MLIVAAHPDDEALGCGGTIAYHVGRGDDVRVLYLSEGVSSRSVLEQPHDWSQEIERREDLARSAAEMLGFSIVGFLRYPNLRMRDCPMLDLVKKIDEKIREFEPCWIYTHHYGDMNSDHGVTFEAVLTACRPRDRLSVRGLFTFEVPSSSEWGSPLLGPAFIPNRFVDISENISSKMAGVSAYASEMREDPHPRSKASILALARYRGASCGVHYAEGFMVIRECLD